MFDIDYIKIGKKIRDIRTNANISQAELAAKIGITKTHISNIERARTKLTLTTLITIANALNVTPNSILQENFTAYDDSAPKAFTTLLSDCTELQQRYLMEVLISSKARLKDYSDALIQAELEHRRPKEL